MGVSAIKVEGRQRSPAYVAQVTQTLREARDAALDPGERFTEKPAWQQALGKEAEGQQQTLGAYSRPWR
jgi:O2-independent ubiquinone biosynthesis protein UbiU